MSAFDHTFRAAIPGSSLAHHKLGELPHEKPPQFTDPNQALEFIWKQLHNKTVLKQLWQLLEGGANVRQITLAVLYKMALEGVIQMNLGVTLSPVVAKMIMTLGQSKGIKGIKMMPKFKDPVKDNEQTKNINNALNRQKDTPLPQSAMQYMQLPGADKVTQDAQTLVKQSKAPPEKAGLIRMAEGNE